MESHVTKQDLQKMSPQGVTTDVTKLMRLVRQIAQSTDILE
jgi:hypothetical protein